MKARVLPNGPETVAVGKANQGNVSVGPNFILFVSLDLTRGDEWSVVRPAGGEVVKLSTNSSYTSGVSILGNQVAWGEGPVGSDIRVFTATVK